jgi:hypothetical protein
MMNNIFSMSATNVIVSSLLLCAISGALVYVINVNKKKRQYIPVAKVLKIIIYPIKSLAGIEIDRAIVTKSGLKFGPFRDRLV